MKTAGKAFSCLWLFIHLSFNKRAYPLGENLSKRNYFLDGKHSMDNFNTTELHRLFWLGEPYMRKKTTLNLIQTNKNNK